MVILLEGPPRVMALVMVQTDGHLQGGHLKMSLAQMAFPAGRVRVTALDQDLVWAELAQGISWVIPMREDLLAGQAHRTSSVLMESPMAGPTQGTASSGERDRRKNRAAGRAPATWVVLARVLTGDHWFAMGQGTSSVPMVFPSGGTQLTCRDLVPAADGGQTWSIATGGDPTRQTPGEIC